MSYETLTEQNNASIGSSIWTTNPNRAKKKYNTQYELEDIPSNKYKRSKKPCHGTHTIKMIECMVLHKNDKEEDLQNFQNKTTTSGC